MKTKFIVLWCALLGYLYKWLVDAGIIKIPSLKKQRKNHQVIVSLTSYGRRISDLVVFYTLVSILRQSLQPDKIILWIDKTKWNLDNIPRRLKSLMEKGVEFEFCDDIRSYTKLVPALEKYPGSVVITVDDDIIYSHDTVKKLYDQYLLHSNAICCMNPVELHTKNGFPCNYEDWYWFPDDVEGQDMVFPCGVEAVLYPPRCLGDDVTNRELFLNLCPMADDVWFWFCGCMNGVTKIGIRRKTFNYSFDALYQYFHKGTALTHTNRFEHQNDKQIRDIFNYYGVVMKDGKIVNNPNIN